MMFSYIRAMLLSWCETVLSAVVLFSALYVAAKVVRWLVVHVS
jgi:hypothetical protein